MGMTANSFMVRQLTEGINDSDRQKIIELFDTVEKDRGVLEQKLIDYDERWKERYLVDNPFANYYKKLEADKAKLVECVIQCRTSFDFYDYMAEAKFCNDVLKETGEMGNDN